MIKWHESLAWLRDNDINLCAIAEPCINTQNNRLIKTYKASTYTHFNRGSLIVSHNNNYSATNYQPGGSLIILNDHWSTRKVAIIQDPKKWGRYCGAIFRLSKSQYIATISGYRCVQKAGESQGVKTSVIHQREGIKHYN
jgi:hypothetical protein